MKLFDKPYVISMLEPECANMSSRDGRDVDTITLHFSKGMGAKGTAKWCADPRAGGAGHFYVDRKGPVYQGCPLDMRAWHHGRASMTDRRAIGIEMANCGHMFLGEDGEFYFTFGEDPRKYPVGRFGDPQRAVLEFKSGKKEEWYWEPYPEPLYESVLQLVYDLVVEFDVPLTRVIGHEDVARPEGRKKDPGPLWPWKRFMNDLSMSLGQPIPDDIWRLHKTVW